MVSADFYQLADFAMHSPETNGIAKPHVDVMFPIRPIGKNGEWGNKQKRVYELDRNGMFFNKINQR